MSHADREGGPAHGDRVPGDRGSGVAHRVRIVQGRPQADWAAEDQESMERDPGLIWFGLVLTILLGIVTGIALYRGVG